MIQPRIYSCSIMAGCNDREELSEVIVKEVQERQLGKEGVFLKLIFEGDMRKKQQSGFLREVTFPLSLRVRGGAPEIETKTDNNCVLCPLHGLVNKSLNLELSPALGCYNQKSINRNVIDLTISATKEEMNTWLFAVLPVLFLPGSLCENPGLRAAITDKGLGFVGHTATTILENALPTLTIPDITGKVKVKVAIKSAHIHYSVTNIKIDNLNIPGCSFTPSANGLTLSSLGNSVKITAHVKAKHKHFPHISASTDIRVDLSDVSFSTAIKLLRNPTNGHATLSTAACSSDVGNVHVSFHGSSSWLYKLFDHEFESKFKKNFHSAFCSKVTDELNNKGNKALESLPTAVKG